MCQKTECFLKIRKTGGFGGLEGQIKHSPRYFSLKLISKIFDTMVGGESPGRLFVFGHELSEPSENA